MPYLVSVYSEPKNTEMFQQDPHRICKFLHICENKRIALHRTIAQFYASLLYSRKSVQGLVRIFIFENKPYSPFRRTSFVKSVNLLPMSWTRFTTFLSIMHYYIAM